MKLKTTFYALLGAVAVLAFSYFVLPKEVERNEIIFTPQEIVSAPLNTVCVRADTLFITAMPEEAAVVAANYKLPEVSANVWGNGKIACLATGIGGKNVREFLSKVKTVGGIKILNVGYCGSNNLEVGDVVEVSKVSKVESVENAKKLSDTGVPCITADCFVESTPIKQPCVFDMELSYIAEKYPDVKSYKLVSDNLSKEQFKKFDSKAAWSRFFKIADEKLLAKKAAAPAKK